MIPISDDLPTLKTPLVTYAIVAITAAVWLLYQRAGFNDLALAGSVCDLGMVPGELTGEAPVGQAVPMARDPATGRVLSCVVDNLSINVLTPLTSMFLHGGWGHILANMLFLWVFGNNVEDSMGHARFLLFYIICGLAAAATHVFLNPTSPIPTVGASGAISGVMGAYLLLYPRARVRMLFFFILIFIRQLPAWLVLVWWFALQVLTGLPELMTINREASGGVAVWAHVGGFIAGASLVKLFENKALILRRDVAHESVESSRYRAV